MVSDTDILGLIDNLRYLLVVWKQHPIFTSWSDVWNYVDECFVLHPHTRASSDESKATASGFICRRNHDLREIRLLKLWCNCISLQCTRGSLEHASIIRAQHFRSNNASYNTQFRFRSWRLYERLGQTKIKKQKKQSILPASARFRYKTLWDYWAHCFDPLSGLKLLPLR